MIIENNYNRLGYMKSESIIIATNKYYLSILVII